MYGLDKNFHFALGRTKIMKLNFISVYINYYLILKYFDIDKICYQKFIFKNQSELLFGNNISFNFFIRNMMIYKL